MHDVCRPSAHKVLFALSAQGAEQVYNDITFRNRIISRNALNNITVGIADVPRLANWQAAQRTRCVIICINRMAAVQRLVQYVFADLSRCSDNRDSQVIQ